MLQVYPEEKGKIQLLKNLAQEIPCYRDERESAIRGGMFDADSWCAQITFPSLGVIKIRGRYPFSLDAAMTRTKSARTTPLNPQAQIIEIAKWDLPQ